MTRRTSPTLIVTYWLFALAATGRSVVQIATDWSEAPLPYCLSAAAALLYAAAATALSRGDRAGRRIACAICATELVGVITVGTLSVLKSEWFPDTTVWSSFGAGYGFVPLVLPAAGLLWLRADRRSARTYDGAHANCTRSSGRPPVTPEVRAASES